jgi:hypothetical protein
MNRDEADEVVQFIAALWDQWQPTLEIAQLFSDEFCVGWLEVEQAKRIVKAVRVQSPYHRPNLCDFHAGIVKARNQQLLQQAEQLRNAEAATVAEHRSLNEWRQFYSSTPHGKAEWNALSPALRRGLRILFRMGDQ